MLDKAIAVLRADDVEIGYQRSMAVSLRIYVLISKSLMPLLYAVSLTNPCRRASFILSRAIVGMGQRQETV
jgi:hypothetical protein